ncbi:hypothetical protein ACFE04_030662 [Oxalis oulophora]
MEEKLISLIMLILGMFVFMVVAKKSGHCSFKSYPECIDACLPGCTTLQPKSTCDPFCRLSCYACPDAPIVKEGLAPSSYSPSPAPMSDIDPDDIDDEAPPCSIPYTNCYKKCIVPCGTSTFVQGHLQCAPLCHFTCSSCPPSAALFPPTLNQHEFE